MEAAQDAVDRIILQEASPHLAASAGAVVVLDDLSGGLVSGLPPLAGIRLHCDSYRSEQAAVGVAQQLGLPVSVHPILDRSLFTNARLVLLRLPKGLAALEEMAEVAAAAAHPDVLLVAGGRDKHMTRSMNAVLAKHFSDVSASYGQRKCRVLLARSPHGASAAPSFPRRATHEDLDLTVCAHGAAFAGTSIDLGTRFLLTFLDQMPATARSVIDLGCGTGVLATLLARRLPQAQVLAVDDSAAGCRSTTMTAAANDVASQISVARADVLDPIADQSADLIVCNPPFHRGTTRDSSVAFEMFAGAGRVLRPGGELWTVFNSHLPYLGSLHGTVGPTTIVGRNSSYLVTRSVAPGGN